METLITLVTILLLSFGAVLAYTVSGRILALSVRVVSLGLGKPLLSFQFRGTTFQLRRIPLGYYVLFQDSKGRGNDPLQDRPKLESILISLSGVFFYLTIGVICIPSIAIVELTSGVTEFFRGAVSPFRFAQTALASFYAGVVEKGWFTFGVGILSVKLGMLKLLPSFGNPVWVAIRRLLPESTPLIDVVLRFASIAKFLGVVSWVIAWTYFFVTRI